MAIRPRLLADPHPPTPPPPLARNHHPHRHLPHSLSPTAIILSFLWGRYPQTPAGESSFPRPRLLRVIELFFKWSFCGGWKVGRYEMFLLPSTISANLASGRDRGLKNIRLTAKTGVKGRKSLAGRGAAPHKKELQTTQAFKRAAMRLPVVRGGEKRVPLGQAMFRPWQGGTSARG